MNFPAKRIALALAFVMAGFAVFALTMPRRKNLVIKWTMGKVEVARGCTVLTPGIFDDEDRFKETAAHINELQKEGPLAMYDTQAGSFWYPTGAWTLPVDVGASETDQYHLRSTIKRGDVVLDVGAGVGTETRSALSAGAGRVVAIEPEPLSLECLRRNLSAEIREKRVVVVAKGVWDRDTVLPLHLDPPSVGGASFVWTKGDQSVQVPVTTIDRIVADLNLTRVDIIKIHIEGAEKEALRGATETIRRYHPRLAIALEHDLKDVEVLPAVARHVWPGYHVELTACTKTFNRIHPGVALLGP
jgi:FkbM family methyltransferase